MSTTSHVLTTFLVNSLWQIPLIAAVAALCAKLMRPVPSAYRHVVWVVALGLCLGLPLTSLSSPTSVSGVNSASSEVSTIDGGEPVGQNKLGIHRISFSNGNHVLSVAFPPLLTWFLVSGYAGFFLYRTARIGWWLRRTLEFRKAAYTRGLPRPLSAIARRCQRAFALPDVAILCSPDALGPVTLSFPHPTLILPERFFSEVSEPDFSSAICHELAHIRRHDFLLNLLYEFASTPIAFNPVTEWIKSQIALTRELACDESAAAKLPTRSGYARSLVSIAQSLGAAPQKQSNWALGLFDANTLEERIMNLLRKTNRIGLKWRLALSAVAIVLLAMTCIGISAFSLQTAQPTKSSDLHQFVGKWTAVHEGTPFMILELRLEQDHLVGGMRMASNFHIDTDGSGPAIQITDKTLLESLPAKNFRVVGKSLIFDYKDYDGDDTHWRLELNGADSGRLSWVELPDGMKAPAIPITKEVAKTH